MRQRKFLERHVSQDIQHVSPEVTAIVASRRGSHEGRNLALNPFRVIVAHCPAV
ncbi:hypothetical protein [Candidatus Binatus sp.]|uniref:hypothetical protein n=1 Tax=Candidatus Binatus sp. TaxID=2811406 RepID=UPI003C591344